MDITIEFISDYLNDKYEDITFLSSRMNYYRKIDYHIYKFLEIINTIKYSWSRLDSQTKKNEYLELINNFLHVTLSLEYTEFEKKNNLKNMYQFFKTENFSINIVII